MELCELLKKYKAEISLEDFGKGYQRNERIVVSFGFDEALLEENETGIVPDLVLGTFIA